MVCVQPLSGAVAGGGLQKCPRCGESSSVNVLDRATAKEVLAADGRAVPVGSQWRWVIVLTLVTIGVFIGVYYGGYLLGRLGLCEESLRPIPEWLTFPLHFCFWATPKHPCLGAGLFFCSWHLVGLAGTAMDTIGVSEGAMFALAYAGTLTVIFLHWHVGLRRWRRGWLPPVGIAVVNTMIALIGYAVDWPQFR